MYTLDTNAVIYTFAPESMPPELRGIVHVSSHLYLSTVTELELFSPPTLTTKEAAKIEKTLTHFTIVPLDSQIARIAGQLRRQYGLKTPDVAIAATALFTNTTLVTRNIRDFRKVEELTLEKV